MERSTDGRRGADSRGAGDDREVLPVVRSSIGIQIVVERDAITAKVDGQVAVVDDSIDSERVTTAGVSRKADPVFSIEGNNVLPLTVVETRNRVVLRPCVEKNARSSVAHTARPLWAGADEVSAHDHAGGGDDPDTVLRIPRDDIG